MIFVIKSANVDKRGGGGGGNGYPQNLDKNTCFLTPPLCESCGAPSEEWPDTGPPPVHRSGSGQTMLPLVCLYLSSTNKCKVTICADVAYLM